jgi:hypothetical protein
MSPMKPLKIMRAKKRQPPYFVLLPLEKAIELKEKKFDRDTVNKAVEHKRIKV